MQINLLCALQSEARILIEYYNLEKKNNSQCEFYECENIRLFITGPGKIHSALATQRYLFNLIDLECRPKDQFFINLGICGCKDPAVPIGSLYLIHQIIDHASGMRFYPGIQFKHPLDEATLTTFDKAKYDALDIPVESLCVDMESSGIFQALLFYITPNQMMFLKMVSDHLTCLEKNSRIPQQHVQKQIQVISNIILQIQQNVNDSSTTKLIFSIPEEKLLHKLKMSMKLSQTQTHQLTDYFYFLKSNNVNIMQTFKNMTIPEFTHKRDINAFFQRLFTKIF